MNDFDVALLRDEVWRLQEELLHLQQKIEELGSANRAPQLQERVRALKGELGVARAAPPIDSWLSPRVRAIRWEGFPR